MHEIILDPPLIDGRATLHRARIARRPTVRDRIAADRWARETLGGEPGTDAMVAAVLAQVAEFSSDGAAWRRVPADAILDADYTATFMPLVRAMTGPGPGIPFSPPTMPGSAASSAPSSEPDTALAQASSG